MRTITLTSHGDFDGWRAAARRLRAEQVPPAEVRWRVAESGLSPRVDVGYQPGFSVPREFMALAAFAVRARDPARFDLLYRILFRMCARPGLLNVMGDPDIMRLRALAEEGGNSARPSAIAPGSTEPPSASMAQASPQAPQASQASVSARARRTAGRNARDGAFNTDLPGSLEDIAAGVDACRRCDLWKDATQGVAGEGPAHAKLLFVGEQPGDQEDLAGKPFVGPAGAMFNKALGDAGVPRGETYVTNAVKHFKHEQRGKIRLHKTPNTGEIEACRWWLDAERRVIRPRVIVALGASAALAVFGKPTLIKANRGKAIQLSDQAQGVVTYHPSFLLRAPDEKARAAAYEALVQDLRFAWSLASKN